MSLDELAKSAAPATPEWLRRLVFVMDDLIRLPGMERGIGLDAIVGFLFPGAGDSLTALTTLALVAVAVRRGVPGVVIARMVLQQLLDLAVGSIPVVGDVFDALHRANRRNLELIEQYSGPAAAQTVADRLWIAFAVIVAIGLVVLPFVLAFQLLAWLKAQWG